MKILVLTTTFPRWKGDVRPAFVFDLCRALRDNGFGVVVLAPHDAGAKKYEVMDGLTVYRFPYFYPHRCQKLVYGGGIWPNFKQSTIAKIQAPFLLLSGIYHTLRIARKENVDLLHAHWILPNGLMGAICSHLQGRKHVVTSHGADVFILEKLPFKRALARYIFKHTDRVTVVSNQIRARIEKILVSSDRRDYIRVLPMGVDLSLFDSIYHKRLRGMQTPGTGRYTLLAIGRLVDKKGFGYLVNALPAILERYPGTELIICGDGPLRSDLEAVVGRLDLAGKVVFKGHVSDSKKLECLLKSDILILPSIVTGSGDTEGLPVVLLEGMAAGVPVVATDVGGIHDVIADRRNGLLIPDKNSEAIAEKVLELLSSPQLMAAVSENARETVKKYGWDRIGHEYSSVMGDVLS